MIDEGIFITGIIGFFTTVTSGWTSWFFTRKKYNSEVDDTLINNMKESLNFYEKLSNDNRERLEELLQRNSNLEDEVKELKIQVVNMMAFICTEKLCPIRKTKDSISEK